ncbi:DNA-processing protein DprA [Clostridium sp. SHJSY1]|uniref:DNA-processing protein DprA n=1 Tax=Clostridium sp. SHJSY1 TaxID=2942483 RepID=UPI0028768AE4|nr:DNA-processing protein DprA [Clostridium sp. SHJSY1]MDS0524904.1 DNA-processing protein DprA [Clostridium sp. SHJSY1]
MKYKIWLLMLNVNEDIKLGLIEKYKEAKEIYNNFWNILYENNINFNKMNIYNKEDELKKAEKIYNWIIENEVGFITIEDKGYPERLKTVKAAPYGLFYKGNIQLLNSKIVAIVGSRNCTSYGIEVTKLLTKELNSYNITIISGGAKGVDSVAHNTILKDNGKTIAVLGSGIDVIYPSQNKFLFKEIEKTGLIVSEFIPGTKPLSYNFPRRNRIISGLSELVIVVEASERSGSLITASYAIEQGRNVMAVPGSVFYKGSTGCNKLIRDGAQVFCSIEDLHMLLDLNSKKSNRIISPLKEKILSIISAEPVHIDDIVNRSVIDREVLFNVLFDMQIKNEIISLPGNYYAKII